MGNFLNVSYSQVRYKVLPHILVSLSKSRTKSPMEYDVTKNLIIVSKTDSGQCRKKLLSKLVYNKLEVVACYRISTRVPR
jgi:hypothetical protein